MMKSYIITLPSMTTSQPSENVFENALLEARKNKKPDRDTVPNNPQGEVGQQQAVTKGDITSVMKSHQWSK